MKIYEAKNVSNQIDLTFSNNKPCTGKQKQSQTKKEKYKILKAIREKKILKISEKKPYKSQQVFHMK